MTDPNSPPFTSRAIATHEAIKALCAAQPTPQARAHATAMVEAGRYDLGHAFDDDDAGEPIPTSMRDLVGVESEHGVIVIGEIPWTHLGIEAADLAEHAATYKRLRDSGDGGVF
jgi:hypothetical protein